MILSLHNSETTGELHLPVYSQHYADLGHGHGSCGLFTSFLFFPDHARSEVSSILETLRSAYVEEVFTTAGYSVSDILTRNEFNPHVYQMIIWAYGNHSSFVLMAYGNEPGGPDYTSFFTEFVNYWKNAEPRIQRWGEELGSIINARTPSTDFDWRDR